jgi:hypothetical protein
MTGWLAKLPAIADALSPAADQVGHIRTQHLPRPLGAARSGRRVPPQVGEDRRAADAQLPRDGGHWGALCMERVQRVINGGPRRTPVQRLSF